VWAWKKKRIHKIAEYSDRIAVIFPFEKELYEEIGADVEYVGHPISEEINIPCTKEECAEKYSLDLKKDWVGFIPGSRNVEIKRILPEIVETIKNLKNIYKASYQFLLSQADSVSNELFQKIISPIKNNVTIIHDTHTLMKYSKVVVCKSGTSTLETGYLGTPMVVVYKTSSLSYFIARAFIKINMIALANIVIGEKVVPELIQHDASAENITKDVRLFLEDDNYYQKTRNKLRIIKKKLGKFNTSEKVALIALSMINET
jgi:lipid-A-disaccharide synthase